MKITCIGGGPGGLYAAALLARADPGAGITVFERNPPQTTFGWGVVFSEATLGGLRDADPVSYDRILAACARWDPVDVVYRGARVRARGNRFAAIARKRLLAILHERCRELGVRLRFGEDGSAEADGADLVIASDGVHSLTRERFSSTFQPRLTREGGKFLWLGTNRPLGAFTFAFRENDDGRFQAHAYPFDERTATFIVECDAESWRNARMDAVDPATLAPGASDEASIAYCTRLFADELDGHPLLGNVSKWSDWTTVRNRTWRHGNVVLLGDAAHTAHWSVGSGTKLAMEDAIGLRDALARTGDLDTALADYESERRPAVERTQDAASESLDWFERYGRYLGFEPPQFAYSLLTRSRRVTYDNLRLRDPELIAGVERWYAAAGGADGRDAPLLAAPAPAFTPVALRELALPNRIVLVAERSEDARDGVRPAESMAAVARLTLAGAGLVVVGAVAVAAEARVTPGCAGLWTDAQADAWADVLAAARRRGGAAVGVQLSHAGARGATRPRREGSDRPLREGGWPLVAASALPYTPRSAVPRPLDRAGADAVREAFVAAARRAAGAGFDLLGLQLGSGYLLASFLSPLTNRREDDYGGALAGRLRFPLEVVTAVREVWPAERPLAVTMSASDLQPGGLTADDAVETARRLASAGADLFDVVAGQTTPAFRPVYTDAHAAGWSDLVRNRAGVTTLTSGSIPTTGAVNDVLAAGKADLCVLGRPLPPTPAWLGGDGT